MRWITLILCLIAAPVWAQSRAPGAAHFAQGTFCAVDIVGEEAAEDTLSGTLNLVAAPPDFYATGPVVPAQIGIGFGVHVEVLPEHAGQVRVTTTHPPMGSEGVTRQSWITALNAGDVTYNGFTFEYSYELVEGQWSFTAETLDGQEIYHAAFTVIDPRFAPPPPCGTAPLS